MAIVAVAIGIVMSVGAVEAQVQTFTVIHTFTGGVDGAHPDAGLTMDRSGNLYGTTEIGGAHTWGTVFKLKRAGSSWLLNPLYSFAGAPGDGADPEARVVFGPDGSLYGTTSDGGTEYAGTVFKLNPPARACNSAICPWTETTLHSFLDPDETDGFYPSGDLIVDQQSNVYGTTSSGGAGAPYECDGLGCGVVYEVSRAQGSWSESILYAFTGGADGGTPDGGVVFNPSGNLVGTGAFGNGNFFQLTPSPTGWQFNVLYTLQSRQDGQYPNQAILFDPSGNMLTTAAEGGGGNNGGTVVELQPSGGGWNFNLLYTFAPANGTFVSGTLAMDAAGNLYGTAVDGGLHGVGAVFKLTPGENGWTYRTLHDFTGGSDGSRPNGGVVIDANGNLYGTAEGGGSGCNGGCGVVWEITP
ncbi:MAG: choice-of-anchor tandem repeat GloVer-containing protein [Candidatus Korobacteraceae bacterium]